MKTFEKFVPQVIGGLLLLAILVANLSVVFRYLFAHPFTWSDEFLRYLFIWVIFIGAALSYRKDGLIDISLVTDLAKGRTAALLDIIRHLGSFAFIAVITWYSFNIMLGQIRSGEVSAAMEMPIWVVTLSLVVGGVIWVVSSGGKLFQALKKWVNYKGEIQL